MKSIVLKSILKNLFIGITVFVLLYFMDEKLYLSTNTIVALISIFGVVTMIDVFVTKKKQDRMSKKG